MSKLNFLYILVVALFAVVVNAAAIKSPKDTPRVLATSHSITYDLHVCDATTPLAKKYVYLAELWANDGYHSINGPLETTKKVCDTVGASCTTLTFAKTAKGFDFKGLTTVALAFHGETQTYKKSQFTTVKLPAGSVNCPSSNYVATYQIYSSFNY
ncbi:hypothetical protein BGZ46_009928 [Entomortierella lignicola]|nr:hypothetical protein BGZ46_009928 [Entomortierella lignicola]